MVNLRRTSRERVLCARGVTRAFARGLARKREGKCAIENVDLDLEAGDVVGVVGSEGAGKTTLLQCLAGLLRRDAGTVDWFGSSFPGGGCLPGLAYVPPMPVYYPFLTVRDVIEYRLAREIVGRSQRGQVEGALVQLGLLDRSACRVAELSRDEAKRLSIAEAVAFEPRVVLVDTSYVDIAGPFAPETLRALRDYARGGAAVVLAARETAEVAGAVTRVVVLDNGRVVNTFHADLTDNRDAVAFPASTSIVRFVAERVH